MPCAQGSLVESISGWAVALSFSYVGLRYYLRSLAYLDTSDLVDRGRFFLSAEFWIRANSVSYAICILTAAIYPRYWTFCSAAGMIWVLVTNSLLYRLATGNSVLSGLRKEDIARLVDDYRVWPMGNILYAVSLVIIGVLVLRGYAKDAYMYAAIAVLINVVVVFYDNCGRKADPVRGGLMRILDVLRRGQQLVG